MDSVAGSTSRRRCTWTGRNALRKTAATWWLTNRHYSNLLPAGRGGEFSLLSNPHNTWLPIIIKVCIIILYYRQCRTICMYIHVCGLLLKSWNCSLNINMAGSSKFQHINFVTSFLLRVYYTHTLWHAILLPSSGINGCITKCCSSLDGTTVDAHT